MQEQKRGRDQRVYLARSVIEVFDQWRVSSVEQVQLLGLASDTRPRAVQKFRSGEPLPDDAEVLERAHLLFAIYSALHTTFPHNPAMASFWITTENRLFSNATPLSVMLSRGVEGLRRIRDHLDSTNGWS
jgi:hypothetical protein